MMHRRELLQYSAMAIGSSVALAMPALAQDAWPSRQVTLIVPFSAGGSADLIARLLAQHLQQKFGASFVIENKGGAGGSLGAGYAAKAAPDGYTLFIGTVSTNAINPFLYSNLPFNVERDFQPISRIVQLPNLMFVRPSLPVKNVPELIEYLKANEGKVSHGSSGHGTSSHLSAVLFQIASGTKMIHVPFRSTTEELNSMMGGHIDVAIDSMTTAWPHAQTGTVRAIGVTTPQRSPAAPDVPAIGETLKGYEATGWQGLFAPAGTPRPIVDKLAAEVKRIFDAPDVAESLRRLGGEPSPNTPDEFAEFTRNERAKWQQVVKASGVRIE